MAVKLSFSIRTPANVRIGGNGMTGELKWDSRFGAKASERFSKAQEYIDSECLRRMDPLTPMRTGAMIKSGTTGTVIGSGRIVYNSPYARRQYYENKGGSPKHPQGGKLWFERMKAQYGPAIKRGAERIAGNG